MTEKNVPPHKQWGQVLEDFYGTCPQALKKLAKIFKNVRNSDDYGFFNGDEKCTDKSVVFASVATLGRTEYLREEYFAPDYFNYLVIDEFHHAVNDQYKRIVEYFKPQFLLGLTATPERMDGRNIYEICDYNADGDFSEDRSAAIEKLKNGEIRVIFSVDMFNEGVDITSVDMVLFLRPTQSPIVFLQQLGRGLRKSKGKEYLNVLDFIGNYEKAGRVRFLLTGTTLSEKERYNPADRSLFPDDCLIDFDMKLIDLFAEMDKKHLKVKDQIKNEYFRVKDLIGKRPSRIELFTYMDDDVYQMPVHFLQESGKGFFVKQDESALSLREDLRDVISMPVFVEQMKDVIEYRTMDYYQRRYRKKGD